MKLMPILKKILLVIVSPLFVILLLATAFDVGFVRTATHPAAVKKIISDSGIYSAVVPALLQQTKTISTDYGMISTADPEVKNAANSALPPQFVQQNTEMAIDNIYQWLDGRIAQPDFTIDLAGSKTLFANKIADTVQSRLSILPPCNLAQTQALIRGGQFDAFNATCLPPGVSPASTAEQVRSALAGEPDFLGNTTLTPADVKNGGSQQSIFADQLKNAPRQYRAFKKTPSILTALTILAGLGVIFLSSSWTKGLRHIGIDLLIVGVIMLAGAWALNSAAAKGIAPKIKVGNAGLQQDVRNLATALIQQIDKNYWFFGGLYAGIGALAIAGGEYFRRRAVPASPPDTLEAGSKPSKPAKADQDVDRQ